MERGSKDQRKEGEREQGGGEEGGGGHGRENARAKWVCRKDVPYQSIKDLAPTIDGYF